MVRKELRTIFPRHWLPPTPSQYRNDKFWLCWCQKAGEEESRKFLKSPFFKMEKGLLEKRICFALRHKVIGLFRKFLLFFIFGVLMSWLFKFIIARCNAVEFLLAKRFKIMFAVSLKIFGERKESMIRIGGGGGGEGIAWLIFAAETFMLLCVPRKSIRIFYGWFCVARKSLFYRFKSLATTGLRLPFKWRNSRSGTEPKRIM